MTDTLYYAKDVLISSTIRQGFEFHRLFVQAKKTKNLLNHWQVTDKSSRPKAVMHTSAAASRPLFYFMHSNFAFFRNIYFVSISSAMGLSNLNDLFRDPTATTHTASYDTLFRVEMKFHTPRHVFPRFLRFLWMQFFVVVAATKFGGWCLCKKLALNCGIWTQISVEWPEFEKMQIWLFSNRLWTSIKCFSFTLHVFYYAFLSSCLFFHYPSNFWKLQRTFLHSQSPHLDWINAVIVLLDVFSHFFWFCFYADSFFPFSDDDDDFSP